MTIERVIVLHGYQASPDHHWFTWLRDELTADGIDVAIPLLPDSASPRRDAWVDVASGAIRPADERTVVVGHSLGAVTTLAALDALGGQGEDGWLAGFVAVAGFAEALPGLPELDAFSSPAPPLETLASRIGHRVVIASDDDTIVPPAASRRLAARLDAELVTVSGGGHFLGDDGFTRLPLVAEQVRSIAGATAGHR